MAIIIIFDAAPAVPVLLKELTDEELTRVRTLVERNIGAPLPHLMNSFPSFTLYDEDGNEVGGG